MKAIVVGGGIIGSAIARKLEENGWEAVVVNHGSVAPATEIAAGILLPDSSERCLGDAGRWSREALRAWDEWYELSETRGAFLFEDSADSSAIYRQWIEEQNLDAVDVSTKDLDLPLSLQIKEEKPTALYLPDARTIITENLVRDLRGPLDILYEKATELLLVSGRARGVRTKQSLLSGDIVVAACGWSDWSWSPIRPNLLPWQGERVLFGGYPHSLPLLQTGEGALVSRGDGKLWAGVSFREDDSGRPLASATAEIINNALAWLPDLRNAHILSVGAGIRPGTDDGMPLLGKTEIPGLYIATGHGRGGILGAPLTAEIIFDIIEGHSSPWAERLSPDREFHQESRQG